MYQEFDIDRWNRKEIYHFFKTYDDPLFNICSSIDITQLYHFCKANKHSFNLALLFYTLQAANEVQEFRLRTVAGKVLLYKTIHCGATILNDDETFSFCYFNYSNSLTEFETEGKKRMLEQLSKKKLEPREEECNLLYYSVIPWISFTSIKHPKNSNANNSIPKMALGKYFTDNNRMKMPISVEANHSLMDGLHISNYLNLLQQKINSLGG